MKKTAILSKWISREFFKLSGTGNDFLVFDNRDGILTDSDLPNVVRRLCQRRISVGADGVILLAPSQRVNLSVRFFNSDGSEAEMCGNGGRCAARVAHMIGLANRDMTFETIAGDIHASILGSARVKLQMPSPKAMHLDFQISLETGERLTVSSVNTGVPHTAIFVEKLETHPVIEIGRAVRHNSHFKPFGTNVDFVSLESSNAISVRTYERGVEDETLACGTGAVAAALIAAGKGLVVSPVSVRTRGGEILGIHFESRECGYDPVFIEGNTRLIFRGILHNEALSDLGG
jgi:diaminopimelate epimerase